MSLIRNVRIVLIPGAVALSIACFGTEAENAAGVPNIAPNVTFAANGTFATPALSGADTLKLAGEPFSINIVANAASPPIMHGPNWAVMSPFKMTGTVYSGLLGPTPVNVASTAASILQLLGPAYDFFETAFPVRVIGISLTINAQIFLPPGTLTTPLIHPFPSVPLNSGNATVLYSDGTNSTSLAINTGTIVATIPTGGDGERKSQ